VGKPKQKQNKVEIRRRAQRAA